MAAVPHFREEHLERDLEHATLDSRVSPAENSATPARDIDQALRITSHLHTTLDITLMLEKFMAEVGKIMPCDGLLYRNPAADLEWMQGHQALHTCSYRLWLMGEALGELAFYRKVRFTVAETTTLEVVLGGLMYPLRNALLYREAVQAALKDALTGIHNRAAMEKTLAREVELAHRHGNPLSLLAIDIDHFKQINDTYGHSAGDLAIKSIVDVTLSCVRGTDMMFRYGGEEFVVLLSNTTKKGAMCLAERIRKAIATTTHGGDEHALHITVSVGVACLAYREDARRLFIKADQALYLAKEAGRNVVKFAAACSVLEP